MNWYEHLFEMMKYIIPLLVVFVFIYFILNNFLEENFKLRSLDLKLTNQQSITPIRLQAYERMIVFLERITPSNMVMRVHKSGMSSRLLHTELVKTIRSEFEHNIAQQIYMSNASWELVKSAKEEIIKVINASAHKVGDNSDGLELCKVLLEVTMNVEKLPTQIALDFLKKEIRQSF
jgi:Na+/H+ antiporter NhaC